MFLGTLPNFWHEKNKDISSMFQTPPTPIEIFLIADLASVSHDQDFEPNLYFSPLKSASNT